MMRMKTMTEEKRKRRLRKRVLIGKPFPEFLTPDCIVQLSWIFHSLK